MSAMLGRRAARQARRQMARLWAQWLAGWGSAGLGSAGGLGGGLAMSVLRDSKDSDEIKRSRATNPIWKLIRSQDLLK